MHELTTALRQPGLKLGVRKAYAHTFDRLREGLRRAEKVSQEIQTMLTGTFRQLNAEYGFSLQAPREPDLARYERDLDLVERSHNQYLGVSNALKLAQPEFADRLVRALATRLRIPILYGVDAVHWRDLDHLLQLEGTEEAVTVLVFLTVALVVGILVGGAVEERARASRRDR